MFEDREILRYRQNAVGYSSIMRGIPASEENLNNARQHLCDSYGISRKDTYVMYRGPRTHSKGNLTVKRDAHSFDIYTRNFSYS